MDARMHFDSEPLLINSAMLSHSAAVRRSYGMSMLTCMGCRTNMDVKEEHWAPSAMCARRSRFELLFVFAM